MADLQCCNTAHVLPRYTHYHSFLLIVHFVSFYTLLMDRDCTFTTRSPGEEPVSDEDTENSAVLGKAIMFGVAGLVLILIIVALLRRRK